MGYGNRKVCEIMKVKWRGLWGEITTPIISSCVYLGFYETIECIHDVKSLHCMWTGEMYMSPNTQVSEPSLLLNVVTFNLFIHVFCFIL